MATSGPQAAVGKRAVQSTCPECGGSVVTDAIEVVCRDCGLVVDGDPIDPGPDWRTYESGAYRSKAHAEPINPDRQGKHLGSEMGFASERDRAQQRRARLHDRAKAPTKKQQGERYAIGEIERLACALGLPDGLSSQATRLFRALHEQDQLAGRDLDTVAATCVYTACRANQQGVAPADVAEVARTDARWIARRHTWVCDTLGVAVAPPDPRQRVRVVARKAGMDSKAADRAVSALDEWGDGLGFPGSPSVVAAAALYYVGGETQATLADAAGCSPTALRTRLRDLNDSQE